MLQRDGIYCASVCLKGGLSFADLLISNTERH